MGKYKVTYSGFSYVEADSEEDAINMAQDGVIVYEETEWEQAEEVDEFEIYV